MGDEDANQETISEIAEVTKKQLERIIAAYKMIS